MSPIWGAKIGHLILDCLVFLGVFIFLKKFKVKYAFLLSLTMFLSSAFVFRMLLIKAQPLAIILILFSTYFIIKRKYIPLAITCFIYVWAYSGWFMAPLLAILYIATESLDLMIKQDLTANKIKIRAGIFLKNCFSKNNLKLIIAVAAGIIIGLVINPYFPKNLYFSFVHIIQIGIINQKALGIGMEWFPFTMPEFFASTAFSLMLLSLPIIFQFMYFKKTDTRSKFLIIAAIIFLATTMRAKRNIEYFVPFSVLAASMTFQNIATTEPVRHDWQIFINKIKEFCNLKIISAVALLAFLIAGIIIIVQIQPQTKNYRLDAFKNSSAWLAENSNPNETIFNLRWDRFPMLFYYNSKNNYVAGLDPTFTYALDKKIWQEYSKISKGQIDSDTPSTIKNLFGATLLTATHEDKKFISAVSATPAFAKVYEDKEVIIYRIK